MKLDGGALEDAALRRLVASEAPVSAVLANGMHYEGRIVGFDSCAIMLFDAGRARLVQRRAIAALDCRSEADGPRPEAA